MQVVVCFPSNLGRLLKIVIGSGPKKDSLNIFSGEKIFFELLKFGSLNFFINEFKFKGFITGLSENIGLYSKKKNFLSKLGSSNTVMFIFKNPLKLSKSQKKLTKKFILEQDHFFENIIEKSLIYILDRKNILNKLTAFF